MPTSSTFTDSLLYIHDGYETARWNFPAAVGTPKADPGGLGTAATVSYSFLTSVPSYFTTSGFRAFSSSEQQAAREALQGWSAVADIHFQEVSGVGAMTFGMNAQSGGSGYAYAPSYGYSYNGAGTITSVSASDLGGDVWINRNVAWTASDFQPGGFGLETLIHEIGHAVGLKHSFESDNGGAVLDPAYDHKGWTVMAYDEHPHGLFRTVTQNANGWTLSYRYIQPETPMIGDIAAIQQLYGANTAYHAGDDVYTFDPARPFLKTIWDGGGSDTISVSDFTERCVIDLTAGNFSSIRVLSDALPPGATETHADLYDGTDNLGIAYGVTIENATGGSGADRLLGNAAANVLKGNAGADTLLGKGGNDTLDGGTGADDLNGAAGNDTYVVDNTGDLVTEAADGGTDRVRSSVTWTLADQVENLTLTGTGKINGSGNGAANVLVGNNAANVLTGKGGADTLTGGGGADVFAFTGLGAADTVTDFVSGTDKLRLKASALPVGDGDTVVEGAVRIAGPGGFARTAELVIVTANIAGNLSAASAAAKIGSASAAYAVGDTALFVVDNGSSSALFYFQAADADKAVEANELTLLATLTGAASTAVGDFVFG